jgi:hypothetical protein
VKITQVELSHGTRKKVCWLSGWEGEFKLKKGLVVTLDGDDNDTEWTIENIFSTQAHYEIRRGWDVGGL